MEPKFNSSKPPPPHHHQSSRTTKIHDLPEETIWEILSRLPAESLISNKLVSKHWYNIISDTKFVDAHLIRSRHQWQYQQALFVKHPKTEYKLVNFTHHKCQVSKLQLMDLEQEKFLQFRSSCNGLLLFDRVYDRNQYYVVNPVTHKYRVLPILKIGVYINHCALIYDVSVKKYKVVAITKYMNKCYVYTLHSNKEETEQIITSTVLHWRELAIVTHYKVLSMLSSPVIVDNKLHWLAQRDDDDYDADTCMKNIIMYTLDISKEDFKETKIPFLTGDDLCYNCNNNTLLIIELMGSLCVIYYPYNNLKQMDIWALQDEEKGEWTKRSILSIPYEFDPLSFKHEVDTSICQGRILVTMKNKIFIYDLKNKAWKTIGLPVQEDISTYFLDSSSLVKLG